MSEKSPIFGATDSTNIEILDTSKIVIKSENITLYKGIFHLIDTFSKLDLGKLIEATIDQVKIGVRLTNKRDTIIRFINHLGQIVL